MDSVAGTRLQELRRPVAYACLLIAAAAGGLAGCSSTVFNPASNAPLSAQTPPNMGAPTDLVRENSIVLSFSGGGLRAAAFAHGVLNALASAKTAEGDLLDDVALISSVSGGSLTAAHYGVYGRDGLAKFRSEVLLPGFEDRMRLSMFNPANLMRMLSGGLNARENFGDTLDRRIFHNATFADIFRRQRPDIRIHATDLYHRVPFPFMAPLFDVFCSDLSRYSVADAVAASMAVPFLSAPVVVRTYPESCQPLPAEIASFRARPDASRVLNSIAKAITAYRDPRGRFIKLADGGLTDNFAVSTLVMSRVIYGTPYAPMTVRDAVRIRRLLLMVVDASRGPYGDWTLHEAGPGGADLPLAATEAVFKASAHDEFCEKPMKKLKKRNAWVEAGGQTAQGGGRGEERIIKNPGLVCGGPGRFDESFQNRENIMTPRGAAGCAAPPAILLAAA